MIRHLPLIKVVPQHCHFEDRMYEVPTLSRTRDRVGKSGEVASRISLCPSLQTVRYAQGEIGLESIEKTPLDAKS